MKNEMKFYRCPVCGNIAELIEDSGAALVCCGQEMQRLTANSVEASQEKHVPAAKLSGGVLTVEIGSAPHPMTDEHHIAWIAVAQDNRTQRAILDKTGKPSAVFTVESGPVTVYGYCNLHGLWMAEVN